MSAAAHTPAASVRPRIPAAIWMLGGVSLLTDLGSEMVHSLLPILLAGGLGASALVIGLIEGAAEALVLVTKLFSGYLSDALGRRKPLVLLGYGLASAVKPLFPLADSVATVTSARLLDRLGKGIRGAPRDALIGDLAPASIRGACFGLRQSMDTVGAVLGPLLAVGLLWASQDDLQLVLWVAVLPGVLAVWLLLRVPEPADRPGRTARLPISRTGLAALGSPFWRVAALGLLVALARCSEAFLVLRADQLGLSLTWIPLVLVAMSLVYAASAWPAGRLSDRWPPQRLLLWGLAVLVLADLLLAAASGLPALFVGIALWGLHMGLTQGVLARLVTDTAPVEFRATAFGLFNLLSALGLLVASAGMGGLWDAFDAGFAYRCFAAIALAGCVGCLLLIPTQPAD